MSAASSISGKWPALLRVFMLLIFLGAPLVLVRDAQDLWHDFASRQHTFVPAPNVRIVEAKCSIGGRQCTIKVDGGVSVSGRAEFKYAFFESMTGKTVVPVRSSADGSITIKEGRERLGQRLAMLIFAALLIIALNLGLIASFVTADRLRPYLDAAARTSLLASLAAFFGGLILYAAGVIA
ncbi:MAG TPA: hypothetical protein PK264_08045 [Hyphomicrobiaceae bacterium]|nr:hypothetical protein [Hyphomicrobiaceae bacterium]